MIKNGFKLPEKIVQIFSAQIADEKDEGRVREKIATAERLCNEAYRDLVGSGFVGDTMVAVTPQGNLFLVLQSDKRPLPEPAKPVEDKLWDPRQHVAAPNVMPSILEPPPGA